MMVAAVESILVELPLLEPFVAAHGTTTTRTLVIVRIETDRGPGWGECSALPAATYTAEWAAGAHEVIVGRLAPSLVSDGPTAWPDAIPGHPMAKAGVEMALLDAELHVEGRSLADRLGVGSVDSVRAGVSIGLDSIDATVRRAKVLAADGFGRMKCKIQPGHDIDLVHTIRGVLPDVELHVDANGAYRPADQPQLVSLVAAGVDAVEQPYPPDEVGAAAALVAELDDAAPVIADEAVESLGDVRTLHDRGALTGVSIKPARVGGIAATLAIHEFCVEAGLAATAGGMLESGLGRHALAAVAALPGFTLTGDVSPARRWLADDPWPDLDMVDGRIAVPAGPGIAPRPDLDLLDQYTVDRRRIEAP